MGKAGRIAGALCAAAAAGGAVWFYARERVAEKPSYAELERDGAFSIRRYPAITVAETVQAGTRKRALNSGFGLLADYIFAESRGGKEIAMTAPVLVEPSGDKWRVRFVMPAQDVAAGLPAPGAGVTIADVPARTVGVVRFGGWADDALLARKERELRDWLAARGRAPIGRAEHAFYNSPFIPAPLRRNEVMLALI